MKSAVHFDARNIGRGFIGDILSKNNVAITSVGVSERMTDELNKRHPYEIEVAEEGRPYTVVKNVSDVNNIKNPDEVIRAIASASIVTTAIGSNILPLITELIVKRIRARKAVGDNAPIDVLTYESMIGGSQYLYQEVKKYSSADDSIFAEQYVGFPNAAVDRTVSTQTHEDPLFAVVEPFNK